MEYEELPAPPPLDSIVRCFWFLRGSDAGSDAQVIVADGRLEIILHLAEPFSRIADDGVARRQNAVLLSGQITQPVRVCANGPADLIGIRFRTAAASTLLRAPLTEYTDRVDALQEIAPDLAHALSAAASRHDDSVSRVTALSDVLVRRIHRDLDPLASAVIRSLDAAHAPSVASIADAYGVSPRTLERKVLAATGLAPSALRRVLRFRRAFRVLDQAPPGTWAGVAASTGYFDQAHLIRDFRQYAGAAPGEFFRTEPELARAILGGETGEANY